MPDNPPLGEPDPSSPFGLYRAKFSATIGFFMPEAMAVWDFFLTLQNNSGIGGNFCEVGVLQGKSAFLGGLYLRQDETCILVDINDLKPVAARLQEHGISTICVEGERSDNPAVLRRLEAYRGTVRWFHVDGDHSGFATTNDIQLADRFLGSRGIICVDDFCNPRYPQLTGAVYKFLFDNSFSYKLLLCGMNKCYIVRSADYAFYETAIRNDMSAHLKRVGHNLTISKSSFAHDMGCFSVVHRLGDLDYFGRDEDNSDIPF